MMLREVIEQYILWRRAHGAKFTTGANLLRHFLRYTDGDTTCDAVTTTQVLAFLAGKRATGPTSREQVLRACRPLASCGQPRPCDSLAVAEQRTEIAAPEAAVYLLL